jgi:putative ABC transport system permease protein
MRAMAVIRAAVIRAKAVIRAAAGGIARRRVQTAVIAVVLLIATLACVLAAALVVDSNGPFDKAFAAQRGADLAVTADPARTTAAQLAATTRLPQVTAAAGPFAEATITASVAGGPRGGEPVPFTETVAGRASPGGPVDDLTLRSGHWPRQDGQIVLGSTWPGGAQFIPLGATVTVDGLPGHPTLTVTGFATSVTQSADAWVLPAEIARLRGTATPAGGQMLYRFRDAATATAITSDLAAVSRMLPAGAVTGTLSYRTIRSAEQSSIAPFLPFIVAFGVIGLAMSLLIVASVVSGTVVAGYGRIGVLKSIGFTPGQVVAAYAIQAVGPAAAGCLAGAALGVAAAGRLVLTQTATAYGVGTLGGLPGWLAAGAPAALCALTGLAVLPPALRAGRLTTAEAVAAGHAHRPGHGHSAHRLTGLLPLPRPVTAGLAAPFARPARTAVTLIVMVLGATAVTFGAGLSTSLPRIQNGLSLVQTWQDFVGGTRPAGNPQDPQRRRAAQRPLTAGQQATAESAIRAQPETLHYAGLAYVQVTVPGLAQQVPVTAFRGDASWIGYPMVSGRWFTGPGQADAPLAFLTATGTKVGDTVTIAVAGRAVRVRIVGDVFDTDNDGLTMLTSLQTLARADPVLAPDGYAIGVRPGTNPFAYEHQIGSSLRRGYTTGSRDTTGSPFPYVIVLTGTLVLLLAVAAALGVVNTVVLQTRERTHDLGVFKAIGMTPRQALAMVVCWVAGTGLAAGVLGVAAGMTLHRELIPRLAYFAGNGTPPGFLDVYGGWQTAALALAGLVIAAAGALVPAGLAVRAPAAAALRAE